VPDYSRTQDQLLIIGYGLSLMNDFQSCEPALDIADTRVISSRTELLTKLVRIFVSEVPSHRRRDNASGATAMEVREEQLSNADQKF